MKVTYINDLHVDNHLYEGFGVSSFVDKLMQRSKNEVVDSEMLVIAGDISHHNSISKEILVEFNKYFKYVLFVPGNHDYYLINNEQRVIYDNDSYQRIKALKYSLEQVPNIIIFDESVQYIDINGLRFAGCTMTSLPTDEEGMSFYNLMMNDSRYIPNDVVEMNKRDLNIYDTLSHKRPDIFISHYPLITTSSHLKHDISSISCFKCDVDKLIAPIHFFGHVHENDEYELSGHHFFTNAYGYRGEFLDQTLRSIETDQILGCDTND